MKKEPQTPLEDLMEEIRFINLFAGKALAVERDPQDAEDDLEDLLTYTVECEEHLLQALDTCNKVIAETRASLRKIEGSK